MNSIKCRNCGLSNFVSEFECRRCGTSLTAAPAKRRQRSPRSFSIWSLLLIAAVMGVVYYFYTGVQAEMNHIQADETKRLAAQTPAQKQEQGLSRTQQDRQRAGTYGDAVRESESIQQHNNHIKETEKAMQDASR